MIESQEKKNKIRTRMENMNIISKENTICKFPKTIYLEPTNFCNDDCIMCAHGKCTAPKGFIDSDFAKNILKDAYGLGAREVGFYSTGEPLLNKNLEDYIKFAKNIGYEYTFITTNGALLNETRAKNLIKSGIDSIKLSINGSTRRDYFLMHGTDDFDTVIKNIKTLSNIRNKAASPLIYVSYVISRINRNIDKEFTKTLKEICDDLIFVECQNISGYMTDEIQTFLSVEKGDDFHGINGLCPYIFNSLCVTWNGYMVLCCADFQYYLAVADLKKEPIGEAWNNAYAKRLRQQHLNGDIEDLVCYQCINGKKSPRMVRPICEELAVLYDDMTWSSVDSIKQRILSNKQ